MRVYPNVTYRALRSSSPAFIGAPALWGQTLSSAGNGVKIGIIDDGLDKTHPYFSARGYRMPPGFPKGQKSLTSAKVIVARAFAPRTPKWKYAKRAFDPLNSDHATHVAGHRRRQPPDAGFWRPDLGRRAQGLPRQLQGADGAERVRAERELGRDRRRNRGRGPRRDGRDQPLARRGGDRAQPRHRRCRARRSSRRRGRAGRRRRQQLRGARRGIRHVAGELRPRDHGRRRERGRAAQSSRPSRPAGRPRTRCA